MPKHNSHEPPDTAEQKAQDYSAGSPSPVVIVDDRGKPYAKRENPYKRLIHGIKQLYARIDHGERWMICLTAIVAFTTLSQTVLSCNNNRSTSEQVGKIITAANHISSAAISFSSSAGGIKSGIESAVERLSDQSSASQGLAKTADKQANISLQTLENERPWIATNGAELSVDSHKKVFSAGVTVINGGRTPAINLGYKLKWVLVDLGGRKGAEAIPANTVCGAKRTNFHHVVVPGTQTLFARFIPDDIFAQMDSITAGKKTLYLIGCIDYSDGTGKSYRTYISERLGEGPIMILTDTGNDAY